MGLPRPFHLLVLSDIFVNFDLEKSMPAQIKMAPSVPRQLSCGRILLTFCSKCYTVYLLNQMIIIVYSFLETGNSFWTLHIRFRRGVSTITQTLYKVSEAIWDVLHPIYMSPPTMEDWKQIEHQMELSQLCWLLGWQACHDKSSTKFIFSVLQLQGIFFNSTHDSCGCRL